MNTTLNSALTHTSEASFSPSAQLLRQWSAPGVILAVTNFTDEERLLFHAIQQARRSAAKVLLIHVLQTENAPTYERIYPSETGSMAQPALESLNRMARQLRWVGITCEPLLLKGSPAQEIQLAAKARGADRVLMATAFEKHRNNAAPKTLAEELLPAISIPICTIGPFLSPAAADGQRPGNITLALSLQSDVATPLAFASRLAQEHHAKLIVLHVFGDENDGHKQNERSPLAVASQLPADRLREAELTCPLEIAVRKGDPATEIVKFGSCTNQDFIVLGPVGRQPVQTGSSNIIHRVMTEARCPVIVLGQSLADVAQR